MNIVSIPYERYIGLKNLEKLILSLKRHIPEDDYNDYLLKIKREERAEEFIEDLHEVLAEASIDFPAGRDCGNSIDFDEEFVKKLIIKMLEEEHGCEFGNNHKEGI